MCRQKENKEDWSSCGDRANILTGCVDRSSLGDLLNCGDRPNTHIGCVDQKRKKKVGHLEGIESTFSAVGTYNTRTETSSGRGRSRRRWIEDVTNILWPDKTGAYQVTSFALILAPFASQGHGDARGARQCRQLQLTCVAIPAWQLEHSICKLSSLPSYLCTFSTSMNVFSSLSLLTDRRNTKDSHASLIITTQTLLEGFSIEVHGRIEHKHRQKNRQFTRTSPLNYNPNLYCR